MMSGRIMIASVIAPASSEYPQCSLVTKNSMPNRPYTMDGMPESVSVVMRMTFTSLFPRLAYSFRYTAVNRPSGTASSSASAVVSTVVRIAGIIETFSEV